MVCLPPDGSAERPLARSHSLSALAASACSCVSKFSVCRRPAVSNQDASQVTLPDDQRRAHTPGEFRRGLMLSSDQDF
jgi:hypothetical protein